MKKYKLIKLFPGLPSFLKVGDILCFDGYGFYLPENKLFEIGVNLKRLFFNKETVENNPDYFKMVEEKEATNFIISEFYDPNSDIIYITEGDNYFIPNTNIDFGCGLDYCIDKFKINTVIRISDGVEFSVGSYVKDPSRLNASIHKIKSLKISMKQKNRVEFYGPDCIYVTYENNEGGNWLDNLALIDVILETEDKCKLCLGDYVYRVVINEPGYNNLIFTECIDEYFKVLPNSIYFGDKFNAELHISVNSIKYSYKDILNACSNDGITVQQREELGLGMFKTIIDLRKLTK